MRTVRTSGFSLIEVLFTLVIISVAAVAIAKSGMTNIAATANAIQLNTANQLGQSRLNESIALAADKINRSGKELINKTEFQWQAQGEPVTVVDKENKFTTEMTRISVTVSWEDKKDTKTITLRQYTCQQGEQKAQP